MAAAGEIDLQFMQRAIDAGRRALGRAWPNPAVGCVVVADGKLVAEGWTGAGGRPHAEEQALAAAGALARGADAYVTLEPCCTRSTGGPACSTLLIEAGVRRVVVACEDPTPNAGGGGLRRLRDAGVEVQVGLLCEEAAMLSAGFVHRITTGRPVLEVAAGPDGFDAELQIRRGETLDQALLRYGREGVTRLWTRAARAP
jgi:diaminohydroxyphosphoribosylaminopyrimidine deaminase/5-amino-6-(5-phosphoribosylamino)uracil reductase